MKVFATKIQAIDPKDGELKTWGGPNVKAISKGVAQMFLDENELGYCELDGIVTEEIPQGENGKADFSKSVNYSDITELN